MTFRNGKRRQPAYDERAHRALSAALKREPRLCWRGCGRVADTVGHVPTLAEHEHVANSGCCELLGECHECNNLHGARLGNRIMRTNARTRSPDTHTVPAPPSREWWPGCLAEYEYRYGAAWRRQQGLPSSALLR